MSELLPVTRYQVSAKFLDASVAWEFSVETPAGAHTMLIHDGAEIPVLLDLVRSDRTVFFDPSSRRLTTGWNVIGSGRM